MRDTIEELSANQAAWTTDAWPGGRQAPDLGCSPSDYSIVIVDNVVRTNTGRKARLEELAAW